MMSKAVTNPALRYYGGKFRLGWWIAAQFPPHVSYVEPFGGAAGVLLRKHPVPVEVYNDLDGMVVNFFRVLREQPQELVRMLKRTPFSRAEFDQSYEPAADPLEAARRFFIQAWQGFGGPRLHKITGWKMQKRIWTDSRANQMEEWHASIRNLLRVARRFRSVQIESDDALKVIRRFDTVDTLFYCDPPYPSDTRNETWCKVAYTHEFTSHDHVHLANLLKSIDGMAAISSYANPLYSELFADCEQITKTTQTMNKTIATEVIYLSPKLSAARALL
ncbi:MAG: DNA adenine methylase [Acidobacteriota bacterium]